MNAGPMNGAVKKFASNSLKFRHIYQVKSNFSGSNKLEAPQGQKVRFNQLPHTKFVKTPNLLIATLTPHLPSIPLHSSWGV